MRRLWSIRHILRTWNCCSFPDSGTEHFFERTNDSRAPRKSLQRRRERWQRHWNMVSRNAYKHFTNVGRNVSLSKGTTSTEYYVNICKVTYFWIMNQFMLSTTDLRHLCKPEANVSHSISVLHAFPMPVWWNIIKQGWKTMAMNCLLVLDTSEKEMC
jgi:hypothetical protein